ncbi:MAG TPA: NAD-dependent epimerase/dehydratase family protein [Nitrospiraceae bacterium]|nr:NAD-dependent epimerase/dehydratase family protein [Nitrospiraceae bacterium]
MARTVVLITGGSGFIGRNLVESLKGKYEILSPSRQELDLLDEQAIRRYFIDHHIDVVVHSATTPGHRNAKPVADLAIRNQKMFFGLARNRDRYGKLIFLSSGAVYDMRHYLPNMKEEYFDTHVPVDEHGFSKYVCAKYIEAADKIVELRLFGVFGKYEDYEIRFISNAICKAIMGLPITIKQNRTFDYLYVEDLATVVDHFIMHEAQYKTYNVTSGETIDLGSLAEIVCQISGERMEILIKEEGWGVEYSGDNSRLRESLPHLQLTPLSRSIPSLYAWYEANRHLINRDLLLIDK